MAHPGDTPQSEHRRLIVELRQARDARRLTQKEVADALDWSSSKLIRIERGTVGISITDLKALLLHYDVTKSDDVERMVAMARASKKTAWWQQYREVFPPDFFTFLGLEASAGKIKQFQGLLIPGLLQSPGYIKGILRANNSTPEQEKRGFEVRTKRQELITEHGPELLFILDESTLYRTLGDNAVMREQMRKLQEAMDHPRVTIRVIPFSAGALRAMTNSFEILEFSDDPEDFALLVNDVYRDQLTQVPSDAARTYAALFPDLEELALSRADTARRIEERLKELE
jgi:transcriptional regulator with XRE-family HTH domain